MYLLKKLKAGALQYTLFIAVIIALLVAAFISLSYLHQKLRIKATYFQETIHNTSMSFDYLLDHKIPYDEITDIQLNQEENSKTSLLKKHWGVFDLVTSKSQTKNEIFEKIGIIGNFQPEKKALYLKDNNKPLVLVGNTKIQGNVSLPKQGVKRGNIAGNSYYGTQLIYGNSNQSNQELPEIINEDYIKRLSRGITELKEQNFFQLTDNLYKVQSFKEETLFHYSPATINLQFIELTGNLIIQSGNKIIVHRSAILKDVILIAPEIEIKNDVKGNFQAMATQNITVGKNCTLNYPSVLCIVEKEILPSTQHTDNNDNSNQIRIDSDTIVKGIVAFLSENTQNNYKSQILLEENTTVIGEVYCDKNFELKGTVNGMVYTDHFIATQFGSIYQNHIFNGRIIEPDLPIQYCGLQLNNERYKVAKWLY